MLLCLLKRAGNFGLGASPFYPLNKVLKHIAIISIFLYFDTSLADEAKFGCH